jgi:hypothetical protein
VPGASPCPNSAASLREAPPCAASAARLSLGRRTRQTEHEGRLPGTEASRVSSPPMVRAIRRAEYVPRPVPPVLPWVAYLSKNRSRNSGGVSPRLRIRNSQRPLGHRPG